MRVVVSITRKPGLSDPEGVTTAKALRQLGFAVDEVHFGKTITVDIDATEDEAVAAVTDMCRALLANPVIEDFTVSVADEVPG
jgi:phosphoribosylformylglycinamidine synthase subunit PurS